MRYRSTRGGIAGASFEDVLLAGLAPDGGLFLPETWPRFTVEEWSALTDASYPEVVTTVAERFVGDAFDAGELAEIVGAAYQRFRHPEVAPVRLLRDDVLLLELFWGPTLSFKDYALQLLGEMFHRVLERRNQRVTVVGATSGDTGSAAIEALRGRDTADVVILHPHGRISDVQRRQMTTVTDPNVHNIAIEGTFDDCQDLVKAMFADAGFRQEMKLSAVNSINFARIMAQMAYYAWAVRRLDASDAGVAFAVPTGNFGNIYAGYAARLIGVPVNRLVAGNNRNNGLNRFFRTGTLTVEDVRPTVAPAMDIQVPSNLERLLFDVFEEDTATLSASMLEFRSKGTLTVPSARLASTKAIFDSMWMSDEAIEGFIGQVAAEHGVVLDPHTAIAVAAAYTSPHQPGVPFVAIATAHPAKFPDAVERATGTRPELPDGYGDVMTKPERCDLLPNDLAAVQEAVRRIRR